MKPYWKEENVFVQLSARLLRKFCAALSWGIWIAAVRETIQRDRSIHSSNIKIVYFSSHLWLQEIMVHVMGFEVRLLTPNTFLERVPSIALYNIHRINSQRSPALTALEADERAIHISVWWKLMEDNVTENTASHGSHHEQRKNSFTKIEAIIYCFPKCFRVIRIVDAFAAFGDL